MWVEPCDLSGALRYLNRALRAKSSTARQNNYVQNENADSLIEKENRLELILKEEKSNVSQMLPTKMQRLAGKGNLRTRF